MNVQSAKCSKIPKYQKILQNIIKSNKIKNLEHSTCISYERPQSTTQSKSEKIGWTLLALDCRCRLCTSLRISQTNSLYYKTFVCLGTWTSRWSGKCHCDFCRHSSMANVLELQRLTNIKPGRVGDERPTNVWSLGSHLIG